jgi:hypothetical protein
VLLREYGSRHEKEEMQSIVCHYQRPLAKASLGGGKVQVKTREFEKRPKFGTDHLKVLLYINY